MCVECVVGVHVQVNTHSTLRSGAEIADEIKKVCLQD